MIERAKVATDLIGLIRQNTGAFYPMMIDLARYINSLFCPCRYVEYWVFDLNFGRNQSDTEMGIELRGIDTIEKFVTFLQSKA